MLESLKIARVGLLAALVLSYFGFAAPSPALAAPTTQEQAENIETDNTGTNRLVKTAPPASSIYGSFKHFGFALSSVQELPSFDTLTAVYSAATPADSAVLVDVRASVDGVRWSEWNLELANGAQTRFGKTMRFAQYRVTLLGNDQSPAIGAVTLLPERGTATFSTLSEDSAPTFKVHATRMGMVGGRTANGHRITKRDHYVSLPSRRSLSSKGGNEYMVRVTYNGRSSVAPVYDIGPWNERDDYWNVNREKYKDLPQGTPEDHAAYFDGYNKGRADKGKVSFPTAIDIGDGVWWDDLGIDGDRAVVEVTFLWMGSDSGAGAAPAEPAPKAEPAPAPVEDNSIVVDNGGDGFSSHAAVEWYDAKGKCSYGGHSFWTYSSPDAASSENSARWQPTLPSEALYDVYAYVPSCKGKKAYTSSAHYVVHHRDGEQDVAVNQAKSKGKWVLLGRFPFAAGGDGFVDMNDVTGEGGRVIHFDAIKWVPAS